MKLLNRTNYPEFTKRAERIIQFGEGNFLRAFADWIIDELNNKTNFNAGVVAVQPIKPGLAPLINLQDGLYTHYQRGVKNGETINSHSIINCIQRCINPYDEYEEYLKLAANPDMRFVISNTTEAGIAFNENDTLSGSIPESFPAKVTLLLYERYKKMDGDFSKGLIFLCCELIDKNAENLRKIVFEYIKIWRLELGFALWIEKSCAFCNTLVDRIVPGYPKDTINEIQAELGYEDKLVVVSELFHLWVIEAPAWVQREIPVKEAGINVVFVESLDDYRTRKVRILNGAHTASVTISLLAGIETVRESVEHPLVGKLMNNIVFNEIIPSLPYHNAELTNYAQDVFERFRNPFIKHQWTSILLNSTSKFKARVLPSMQDYFYAQKQIPKLLCISLASLIFLYRQSASGKGVSMQDDDAILNYYQTLNEKYPFTDANQRDAVIDVLSNKALWNFDITELSAISENVILNYHQLLKNTITSLIS